MKPVNFEYARPTDVNDAISLLDDESRLIKIMAGCQSLGPMLNLRLVQPDLIVDITAVEELRSVENKSDALVLGACVTHADIEDGRVTDVTHGVLGTVAHGIAYRAVRNRGTIGGSLTHADPSADWVTVLSALDANVQLRGPRGNRSLPVADYIIGALEVDLSLGEMLVSVTVPKVSKGAHWGYYKSCRKTGDFADASGAVLIDRARGVSRAVIGATEGRPLVLADAHELIDDDAQLLDNFESRTRTLLGASGMIDRINQTTHIVALRRAVEGARLL